LEIKDNIAHSSSLFRDQQRERYLMPLAQLADELATERENSLSTFFKGRRYHFNVSIDRPDEVRFSNEVAALRAYCRATIALQNCGLSSLDRLSETSGSSRSKKATVRPRGKSHRQNAEPKNMRQLEDFVDVGSRLNAVDQNRLVLLIDFYIIDRSAEEIAKEYGIAVSTVGGRISQARNKLRQALDGIVPQTVSKKTNRETVSDQRSTEDKRRDRAATLLKKRLEQREKAS
jgi:predicted DNA-binding protein YlxM (UPF0122 family)